MNKISVLMPTYNDAKTIVESLDSLIRQTYKDWELIIIDDGSSDNTEEVIREYKKKQDKNDQIKYIKQENQDQLLAIINGLNYVTGDIIYILHSDDLLYDENVFDKAIKYFKEHKDIDAIIGDLTLIDANSKVIGKEKVLPYIKKKRIPVIQLLWLGRNLYVDMAFYKIEAFKKNVFNNYLTWDKPFWLDTIEKVDMLNIDKVDFCFFRYRVFEENYANDEIGKLCLINGELRTATQLMNFYNIPGYKIQYLIYRIFCHLGLFKIYCPIYQNKQTKNKYKVIDFIIKKRYPEGYENNDFFRNLTFFYKKNTVRAINFDKIYNGKDPIYLGNNFRIFNKQLVAGTLPKLYNDFFKEMEIGFNEIIVSKKNKENALNLTKFLCIYPFVKITEKNKNYGKVIK